MKNIEEIKEYIKQQSELMKNKNEDYNPLGIILLLLGFFVMFIIVSILSFQEYPISTIFGIIVFIILIIGTVSNKS
jgi:hypothetical protein